MFRYKNMITLTVLYAALSPYPPPLALQVPSCWKCTINKSASITLWCGCTWLLARLSLVGYTPMGFPIAAIGRRALWPVMDGAETNLYLSEVTEKLKNPLFRTTSYNLSFFTPSLMLCYCKFDYIYPSRRHNLPPTWKIITRNFLKNSQLFQNFEKFRYGP